MSRLLFIQNSKKTRSADAIVNRFSTWNFQVETYMAVEDKFPASLSGYAGIVISGGPNSAYDADEFILNEHEMIKKAEKRGIPMLGLCLGSQILASSLCGSDQVFRREACEVGFVPLIASELSSTDDLFTGAGADLRMFVWHNDDVRADHPDVSVLASSKDCLNQIWRYRDSPVWGIQGHPEVGLHEGPAWFEENRVALGKDNADVDALVGNAEPTRGAEALLQGFARICGAKTERSVAGN